MTGLHTVFDRDGPLIDHAHRRQTATALVS